MANYITWPVRYAKKGPEIRKEANNYFTVVAVTHLALLPNQVKVNYFGQVLTSEYYCFEFTENSTGNYGNFVCGSYAANDWLTLTGQQPLPLFNPLVQQNQGAAAGIVQGGNAGAGVNVDPQMRRLISALRIFISLQNISSSTNVAFGILRTLEHNAARPPSLINIRSVNTLFYKVLTVPGNANYSNYTDYVRYESAALGINIRVIPVNDFNQEILANPHTDPKKRFPPSF